MGNLVEMGSEFAEFSRQLADILRTLSPDQLKFVECRIYERTDADAARILGIPVQTIYNWDNKADVNEAVKLARMDGVHVAQERLHRLMGKAIDGLESELDNDDRRMEAVREVLDRTLGKPVQRNENKNDGGIEVVVKHVQADRNRGAGAASSPGEGGQ